MMESIFCKKAHRSGYGALKNKLGRLADSDYEEEELLQKTKRLDELNILLNMDKKDIPVTDETPDMVVEDDREKGIER